MSGFASAMKPLGFTKQASNLWRENPESRDLISFSGWIDKASGNLHLVGDYAVFLKAFDPFYRDELDLKDCTPLNGDFSGRLGARQHDKYWPVTGPDDVDPLVTQLVDLAKQEMLPFLEERGTVQKSLALCLPGLKDKYLAGRTAVDIMIMARLCNQPAAFLEAQLRAREKLETANPAFLQKAQRFVAQLRT